jgi:hypothetical protein
VVQLRPIFCRTSLISLGDGPENMTEAWWWMTVVERMRFTEKGGQEKGFLTHYAVQTKSMK